MFLFILNMKIAFNCIFNNSSFEQKKKSLSSYKTINFCANAKIPDNSFLKPLTNIEKKRRSELKAIEEMSMENGVFSIDKAAELLKDKIDKQQMLYSEKDIKDVILKVAEANPDLSKKEILMVLMKLSSFSNYESLVSIENFCKKNKVSEIYNTKGLSINNAIYYFSRTNKGLLNLPNKIDNNFNRIIIADRETIEELKHEKETESNYFSDLKANIKNGSTKLVVLDGFEAKTKNGLISFNFAGKWGNLAEAVNYIIKEEKEGKKPFVDDIIEDLKNIFGEKVKINILKNDVKNVDEKTIAARLNSKTLSINEIKKTVFGISKYTQEVLNNNKMIELSNKNISLENIQKALMKAFYPVIEVYSPRRIATEMRILNKKIEKILSSLGKTFDDVIFIVPDKHKSFGLISYQYAKVNNQNNNKFIYPNYRDSNVDRNLTRGKIFVFLDDFSGSGQSFLNKDLPYMKFKKINPANSIIFAPVAYTGYSQNKIKKENINMHNSLRNRYNDYFVGGHEITDMTPYIKLFSIDQKNAIIYAKKCGYDAGMSVIAFPHVIPDNCSDIAGLLLQPLLKSDYANKSLMNYQKKCRIEVLSKI